MACLASSSLEKRAPAVFVLGLLYAVACLFWPSRHRHRDHTAAAATAEPEEEPSSTLGAFVIDFITDGAEQLFGDGSDDDGDGASLTSVEMAEIEDSLPMGRPWARGLSFSVPEESPRLQAFANRLPGTDGRPRSPRASEDAWLERRVRSY